MNWFKQLFGKKPKTYPVHSVKQVKTADPLEYFERTGHCPDCKHEDWIPGPTGGMAMNICCRNCGTALNAAQIDIHRYIFAERISNTWFFSKGLTPVEKVV